LEGQILINLPQKRYNRMSNVDYYPKKLRTARCHPNGNQQTTGNTMGHKVLLRNQQRVIQESTNDRKHTTMVTTRQGKSTNARSKTLVNSNNHREGVTNNDKYLRTGQAINTCPNKTRYEPQEYVGLNEHDGNEDEENEDNYEEEEESVVTAKECYNYEAEEDCIPVCGENDLNLQMTKVITDLNAEKSLARKTYNDFCQKIGTMDNHNVLQETVRRTTRKQAWKNFKLLEEEDYQYNSTFAMFIFESLGIDVEPIAGDVQRQELWLKFKKYVSEGMQAARSSATQAIKKQFIGKRL
jgi:hypothetical protein